MTYPKPTTFSSQASGLIIVILATMAWSTSSTLINLIVAEVGIPAVNLAFWRDISTFSVLLVGISILKPQLLRVQRKDLPWLMGMGAISIGIFHVMWNTSVVMLGASLGTVIQCNAPIFVTLLAWVIFKEPLTKRKVTAVGLSVVGTILSSGVLKLGVVNVTLWGLSAGLLSAISYGSFSLFGKKLTKDYNPWTILVYIFGFATLTLTPFQVFDPYPWAELARALPKFAALIFIPTIGGFLFYTLGLKRLQASVAAITGTAEIVFAAILAYFVLSERLDAWQILGAICIIAGVVLVSLPNRKNRIRKPTTARHRAIR